MSKRARRGMIALLPCLGDRRMVEVYEMRDGRLESYCYLQSVPGAGVGELLCGKFYFQYGIFR